METKAIKETQQTTVSGVPSWTPEEEAGIAELQAKRGMSRPQAVKTMKAERTVTPKQLAEQQKALDSGINTKLTGKAKPAAKSTVKSESKAKAPRAPKLTETTNHKPTPKQREAID